MLHAFIISVNWMKWIKICMYKMCNILLSQGKENLGMVMVFTLVSAGQEWLNEKWDNVKKDRDEKVLAKQKADEEAEMVCWNIIYLYGTKQWTILSFTKCAGNFKIFILLRMTLDARQNLIF